VVPPKPIKLKGGTLMQTLNLTSQSVLSGDSVNDLPGTQFSERVILRQWGQVTLIQLSRPEKRNAIDAKMLDAIKSVFSSPPAETKAVVLHGAGDHFCAGADLGLLAEGTETDAVRVSRSFHEAFDRIEHGPVPVIAALHGAVIGGGLELAAATHIRVAERNTYFALPEGMRGIFVGGGGAVRIPRLIGISRMIDMMLTGRTYNAELESGFSQYVVDNGTGLTTAIELAGRIASNTTLTNFAVVQALPRIARSDSEIGFLTESLMAAIATSGGEAKARLRDFVEKRGAKVSSRSISEEQ
jgi:(methylthio)acryloyl-CoA hydratase